MSAASIQAALDGHLQAAQEALIAIAWEGVAFTPDETAPYLATRMAGLTRRPTGPGADSVVEWSGRYQINANFPVGQGKQPSADKADDLLALFPRGLSLPTSDGWSVRISAASPMPSIQANNWLTTPIVIEWFAHEFP